MLSTMISIHSVEAEYVFTNKWGTHGSGDGQFNNPFGVAVDSSGNVYVVDSGNQRIQKFTNIGTFIAKWGTPGSGDGQFQNPSQVAVGPAGNVIASGFVYVTDLYPPRIQVFSWKLSNQQ